MKKRLLTSKLVLMLSFSLLAFPLSGCEVLGQVLGQILGVSLLGVQPADNFSSTGNIEVSLLPEAEGGGISLGSLKDSGLNAEIDDENGNSKECDFIDEKTEFASEFNSLVMLIDDSGSMGLTYDADVCSTCPHDPDNLRASAVKELTGIIHDKAPESHIALMDFGPEHDKGGPAMRLLVDFTTDTIALEKGLEQIDGTFEAGTPLWDALAMAITAIDNDADEQEIVLQASKNEKPEETTDPVKDPVDDGTTGEEKPVDDGTTGEEKPVDDGTTGEESPTEEVDNIIHDEVKRYLLVLSDGDDRNSTEETLDSVIALAQKHDIPIYAIGLGPASSNSTVLQLQASSSEKADQVATVKNLQKLAEATGGFYASVNDPTALDKLYQNIARGMTEGYKVTTFACKDDDGDTAESGENVNGRLQLGSSGVKVPFNFIAP